MRAVLLADIHTCNNLPYAKIDEETGMSDRLLDILRIFQEARDFCRREKVEHVFILGDLFHKRLLDAVTLKAGVSCLKMLAEQANVWLLPGNHDASDAGASHYTVEGVAEAGITRVRLIDGPMEIEGFTFLAMPYKPDAIAHAYLQTIADAEIDRSRVFLLMHQTVVGATMGKWVSPDGLTIEELAPYAAVLTGHFHTPQYLGQNGLYLGAPMQHGFGDAGEKRGFWMAEFRHDADRDRAVLVPFPVKAPQFYLFDGRWVDGVLSANTSQEFDPRDSYVQLTVERMPTKDSVCEAMVEDWRQEMLGKGVRDVKIRWTEPPGALKDRLKVEAGVEGKISLSEAVVAYVNHVDVGQLVLDRLLQIGMQALAEVGEV